jgi:hypothetical protein
MVRAEVNVGDDTGTDGCLACRRLEEERAGSGRRWFGSSHLDKGRGG